MNRLNKKSNLTRWNRAGLSRFNYVDGNAITYLESLRLEMAEAFTNGDGENQWQALDSAMPVPDGERPSERQARWLKQYRDQRRDYAWEILRSYARAGHVLTGHLDAYVNESFIGTATQWDNVRRLVEMLNYHPAPPASAETAIVLLVKTAQSGVVKSGFSFKNKPLDGRPAVVFETLLDLEVDATLNELRTAAWDRSQQHFEYVVDGDFFTTTFPLSEPLTDVVAGTLGVLLVQQDSETVAVSVRVDSISDEALVLQGEDRPAALSGVILRHQVRLLLKPAFNQAPQMTGNNVAILNAGHGRGVNDVVAWFDGIWRAARIEAVQGDRVRLSRSAPAVDKVIYLVSYSDAQLVEGDRRVILPSHNGGLRKYGALWGHSLSSRLEYLHRHQWDSDGSVILYDYVTGNGHSRLYYVPVADPVATVVTSKPQNLIFDGSPDKFSNSQWLLASTLSGTKAVHIATLHEGDNSFELTLSIVLNNVDLLYGEFELEIRPNHFNVNSTPIFETALSKRSDSFSILPLESLPAALTLGRVLIIEGKQESIEVVVKEVDVDAGFIKVSPPVPGSELSATGRSDNYTRFDTKIYGNVVLSGHGETQHEKILGSGDAASASQRFDLDVAEVSFVRDSLFSSGVRAALEVSVDRRRWQQMETLNDSAPEDHHYVVRMNEAGTLSIIFGDGRYGRRLSSGSNNVNTHYRTGVGVGANLQPYQLQKAVKPHALIDSILQPIASSGGNAMEGVASLREHAPASLLTLARAVSLSDFTHLATANSSVWQARAIRLMPKGTGRSDSVEVVVVPAGGGELASLASSLAESIQQHALPGVSVSVSAYQPVVLDLKVFIRVNTDAYDLDFVAEDVRLALSESFSLQQAKLGASLYYSQVIEVVEGVEGVENCECRINENGFRDSSGSVVVPRRVVNGSDGVVKRVSIDERQIIYLDERLSVVDVIAQHYRI